MLKKYGNEIVVGLFVIVCSALLFWVYTQIKGSHRGEGLTLYADFKTVNGLIVDNAVTMAGVRIGRVGGISLYKGKARVRIQLFPGIKLRAQATAAVQAKSLLGEKVLVLSPGPANAPYLSKGATLKNTLPTVDITDLFSAIPELMQAFRSLGPEIKPLAKEITSFVKNINTALKNDPQGAKLLLRNVSSLISDTRKTVRGINRILKQNRWYIRGLFRGAYKFMKDKRLKESLLSLHKASGKISPLVAELKLVSQKFNRLMNHISPKKVQALIADLKAVSRDIRKMTGSMNGSKGRATRLLRNLDNIFAKLARIEEYHLRHFAQIEGVRVHIINVPGTVRNRMKKIKPKK